MNYKIIFFATFFAGSGSTGYSQTSDAEAEAIVNLLGVQKREAVSKLVAMADKDSAMFWKIYDEYQQINKKTAKKRLGLYERTAQSYANMQPALADSLAQQYFINRSEQETLAEQYYQKIKKAINPVVAFEFYQAEAYLLTQIRAQIMQQIPTYGQLVNAAKK